MCVQILLDSHYVCSDFADSHYVRADFAGFSLCVFRFCWLLISCGQSLDDGATIEQYLPLFWPNSGGGNGLPRLLGVDKRAG